MPRRIIAAIFFAAVIIIASLASTGCGKTRRQGLALAVEYNTHAACAYLAQSKGWLREKGHEIEAFEVYATGVALAAALTKENIDAAYICLVPAITAYANAGVPIKIVCGTHKYGYALGVDPSKITGPRDLEKPGIKIGCVKEGATTDIFLHKIIESFGLDRQKVLENVLRMDPVKQVMAAAAGKLDALLVPEHFATLAEQRLGYKILLKGQDVWPQMQGSVLVVTGKLLQENPEAVRDLLEVTAAATEFLNQNPSEAAEIVAGMLNAFPDDLKELAEDEAERFGVNGKLVFSSMANMEYTTAVDLEQIQEIIDFIVKVGYIEERFSAAELLLEESFLRGE